MVKRRVLYFSIGTFATTAFQLGGNIYGRNLVQRLAEDEEIELFVLNANVEGVREGTAAYFDSLGIQHLFTPLLRIGAALDGWGRAGAHRLAPRTVFRLPFEMAARNQSHISAIAERAIADWRIEHVVVDYLMAVLFWPGVARLPIPKTIVTVNREADLLAEQVAFGNTPHLPVAGRVSHWRLARFERRIYQAFDKVVAIGAPDIPAYLPARQTSVVPSYLDESPKRWAHQGNRTLFFVGNVAHYPNRLAINHIMTELAPRILARVPDARFAIIGASPEQAPSEFLRPEIDLMGASTPSEVERLFTTADLFLCPIANTFGMKFKIAEAASYGTPFIASEQTMLGYPYLHGMPQLLLDDPETSAATIASTLLSADRLKALSSEIQLQRGEFAASQKGVWSRVLFGSESNSDVSAAQAHVPAD